jgi:hypothetical protein
MPDLTTQYAWACNSTRHWEIEVVSTSNPAQTYIVRWEVLLDPNRATEYGYTCTCKGFQMRRSCKHVKAVEAMNRHSDSKSRCGWDGQWDGEDVPDLEHPRCPRCGEEAFSYPYEV